MLYNRGTKGSFALWAHEVGDAAYTWENLLPFHEKSVTFTPPNMDVRAMNASANYSASTLENSRDGPLHLSYPAYAQPLSSFGPAAFAAAGIPPVEDFISGKLDGYNYFAFTIDPETGLRSSAETAFLSPAMGSGRLTVYQWSTAQRILFDDEKRATGVEINLQNLPPYKLHARKEVILSAGAVSNLPPEACCTGTHMEQMRSPHLLMLSGVGPKGTLRANNIPIVHALEGVGQNMHDSCAIGGPQFRMSTPSSSSFTDDPATLVDAERMLLRNGTGPLTNMGADFFAWEKLPRAYRANFSDATSEAYAQWPADWPELEIGMSPSGTSPFADDEAGGAGEEDALYGQLNVILVAAISRGNVSINSSRVADPPVIHTNWLEDRADQQMALAAYRRARDIVAHIGARVGDTIYPNATVFDDDDKLLEFIKSEGVNPIHHASSTNRMGKEGDAMAVVDSRGRVFGVEGLRVVDSSSFRHTPPGHTQATTYMLAEKLVADVVAEAEAGGGGGWGGGD